MTGQIKTASQKGKAAKRKGVRVEGELVDILNEYLGSKQQRFARVGASSGARPKNTDLPIEAAVMLTGDIICPPGFRYAIECKGGYSGIDLLTSNKGLDSFLSQSIESSASIGLDPMVCWKMNRKPWTCIIRERFDDISSMIKYTSLTGDVWYVYPLIDLLKRTTPRFWFK